MSNQKGIDRYQKHINTARSRANPSLDGNDFGSNDVGSDTTRKTTFRNTFGNNSSLGMRDSTEDNQRHTVLQDETRSSPHKNNKVLLQAQQRLNEAEQRVNAKKTKKSPMKFKNPIVFLHSLKPSVATKALNMLTEDEVVQMTEKILTQSSEEKEEPKEGFSFLPKYAHGRMQKRVVEEDETDDLSDEAILHKLYVTAFGKNEARKILDLVKKGIVRKAFSFLDSLDPVRIAMLLRNESDIIIAAVLSSIEPEVAGKVLLNIPKAQRSIVVTRIATMTQQMNSTVMNSVIQKMRMRVQNECIEEKSKEINGKRKLAHILRHMNADDMFSLLGNIKEPDLQEEIKQHIVSWSMIPKILDTILERVLPEMTTQQIAILLYNEPDHVKDKIMMHFSKRKQLLVEDEFVVLHNTPRIQEQKLEQQQNILSALTEILREGEQIFTEERAMEKWVS